MRAVELVERCTAAEDGIPGKYVQGKRFLEKQLRGICFRIMSFHHHIPWAASLGLAGRGGRCHVGSWLGANNLAADPN